MSSLRSALIVGTVGGLLAAGLSLLPAAEAVQAEPPAPGWQAIAALAEDAAQRSSYDAALAWLEARGPARDPITDREAVGAMGSLAQAWAARGDERLERGDTDDGLEDLAAVLRHGAAVERHAHSLRARREGARVQRLALDILAAAPLEALSGAQRAELLMALGESAVLPSTAESLQRQCALDAEALRSAADWVTDTTPSARWLGERCAEPGAQPPDVGLRGRWAAAVAAERAAESRAAAAALAELVDDNASSRAALRERLSAVRRGR